MEQARLHNELNTLERKVQLLLNEYQLAKDELSHLKAENQELKLALKQKDERIKDFQNQDYVLKSTFLPIAYRIFLIVIYLLSLHLETIMKNDFSPLILI